MILITHDHVDHIKCLGPVAEKLSIPVFTTAKIHNSLENHYLTGGYLTGCKRIIKKDVPLEHRGIKLTSFEVPHDATETLGYHIDFFGVRFVFMTDMGDVPKNAMEYCREASHLIIESNYDTDMLMSGDYSPMLKLRILEGKGHLSNDRCGEILTKIYNPNLKSIYLCHLSENNNTPELAYNSACRALSSLGLVIGKDVRLYCLPRRNASPVFEVE